MARPKIPLISRRRALEAALDIVDREGLSALSIRRLGEALNVNGASLYHHFSSKDEILVGATQLALENVTAPRSESENWRVWLLRNTHETRDALVAHPALIPILLRRVPLGIGTEEVEASVQRLEDEGVPLESIIPLMESLELLAIVSAIQEAGGTGEAPANGPAAGPSPALDRAQRARGLTSVDLFETLCLSVMSTVEAELSARSAPRSGVHPPARTDPSTKPPAARRSPLGVRPAPGPVKIS